MNESAHIRILCVDDHPLVHEGIATVIRNQPDMMLIAEAFNGHDAVQKFREHQPDVILLDLRLPDMSGIDTMITIRNEFPEARAIILTTFEGDVEIQRALEAGARAYVLKSMPPKELVEVIRKVHAGKKPIPPQIAAQLAEHYGDESLTEREIDVLRQIAGGNRNGPCQTCNGEAGRKRSDSGRRNRCAPGHNPTLTELCSARSLPESGTKR